MERQITPELQKLFDEGCNIYSISRLNTMNQCPYQAYLNYIVNKPQKNNIWACLGGKIHDALQACIDTNCNTDIITRALQEELDNLDLLEIDFPLDRNGNPTLRNNWIENMSRFAKEFKTPTGKFETEQLILYPIPGREKTYMQGYIDLIRYNSDGSINIYDWKTSSNFDKKHLVEAGRQLILYALAKQHEGYIVNHIAWIMLKYCVTTWQLKNGKTKEKISEWRNLISDLKSPIMSALSDFGYDEMDADCIFEKAKKENTFDSLPQQIKDKFITKIYIREYEITKEKIDETLEYINSIIDMYEEFGENELKYHSCDINKESFFCSSLCGYSDACKYYIDYKEQLISQDEDDDLF